MRDQPSQDTLFGPNTGSARYEVQPEDRYVLTHRGEVVVMGTHAECMAKLAEQVESWRVSHEEDYAAGHGQPYAPRVLVAWALPGEKNFLWTHQHVFADSNSREPVTGLSLLDFLLARSTDATRILVNKRVVFDAALGWCGDWKARMQQHAEAARAANTSH